jgi:NADH-quinone oxidoreductase subunit K
MTITPIQVIIGLAILLAGVGFYGMLVSRNLIKIVVALQIMTKGALLLLVVAGQLQSQIGISQAMALMVIIADTIVAVVGLALAVQVRRRVGTLDVKALATLRR